MKTSIIWTLPKDELNKIARKTLKKRLIELGLIENKCSICNLTNWLNKPLVLRLDHRNGIHDDNRLNNLRLLCPNCDSQQPTYAGRNKYKENENVEV